MNSSDSSVIETRKLFAPIPGDWGVTCVVRPWEITSYCVEIKKRQAIWMMGIPVGETPSPTLSWFVWRIFFAILTFIDQSLTAMIGYREICRRMQIEPSGQTATMIRLGLRRLHDYWVRLDRPQEVIEFSLLKSVSFKKKKRADAADVNWTFEVSLRQEFYDLITGDSSRRMRFDLICNIRSAVVAGLYMFLPAWAYNSKSETSPVVVAFSTIAAFLNKPTAPNSIIQKILSQHSRATGGAGSVVEQLDGRAMKGGIMRCVLKNSALHCWCEPGASVVPTEGRLLKSWTRGGGKQEHFAEAFSDANPAGLSTSEWDTICSLGVVPHYRPFFESAARLLHLFSPPAVSGIIAIAADRFATMHINDPAKVLATMFLDAVEAAPGQRNFDGTWWLAPVSRRLNRARNMAADTARNSL